MAAIFQNFYKTVAAAAVPEAIGAATVQFNAAIVTAAKSNTEANAGNVFLQYTSADGDHVDELYPGNSIQILAPLNGIFNAAQFFVDVAVDGDGVLFTYLLADPKAFNDVELKTEAAMRKLVLTIAATIDDCSVTSGISDMERTGDNINCYVTGSTEAVHNTGLWSVQCGVTVRSRIKRDDKLNKHRLRTAYVRDLFMDTQAADILSALERDFTACPRSIRERATENRIEGEFWVSELRFVMTACGSSLV